MSDVAEYFRADSGVPPVPGGVLDEADAEFVGGAFKPEGNHFFFFFSLVGGEGTVGSRLEAGWWMRCSVIQVGVVIGLG